MNENLNIVIMAGGHGERLWPLSRKSRPKQILPLLRDDKSLVEQTLELAEQVTSLKNVWIAVRADLYEILKNILPIPASQFIVEPLRRDTAAAVGLASAYIHNKNPNSVIAFIGTDYLIDPPEAFHKTLLKAIQLAESGGIVVLGIPPSFPNTTLGYIEKGERLELAGTYNVKRFVEKPDYNLAKKYVESGNFYWNSGMFIAKSATFLTEIKQHHTPLYHALETMRNANFDQQIVTREFQKLEAISFDYAVMEKSFNIKMVEATFKWTDIGNWAILYDILEKNENSNVVKGTHAFLYETQNSLVWAEKPIVTFGISDLVVISLDDVVLVMKKDNAPRLKEVIKLLKNDIRSSDVL